MNQLEELKKNIGDYIDKQNRKDLLRGLILSAISALSLWIVLALLEYFGNFSETTRTALFYSFIIFTITVLTLRVFVPILRMFGLIRSLDTNEAAKRIGNSMKPVEDKLINTIALSNTFDGSSNHLVMASINQRAQTLSRYDFAELIKLDDILSLVKYLVIPIIVFITLSLLSPASLIDSSMRLIKYDQSFVPPAPFEFEIQNENLVAIEGEPFTVMVTTNGRSLPTQVYMTVGDKKIRMKQTSAGSFEYTLDRMKESVAVSFSAVSVSSDRYEIKVKKTPKILRNIAQIIPPAYTKLDVSRRANQSQISVAEGTQIAWNFDVDNTTSAILIDGDSNIELQSDQPSFESQFRANKRLRLALRSADQLTDTAEIVIDVIPDRFPHIQVDARADSAAPGLLFFNGEISDDYGFSQFHFKVEKISKTGRSVLIAERLDLGSNNLQSFSFIGNLDTLVLDTEESLEYYFEVFDNDGINGAKSTRSQTWKLDVPSKDELRSMNEEAADESKQALQEKQDDLSKANKDLDELKKDLLQKKRPDWQDKEKLKELVEERQEMLKQLEEKMSKQRQQNELNTKFNQYSEELLDKQKQIEELFEELFDEEFKEKYNELKELMDKLNKDQMLDKLDEMKLDNEQLEKELDRTLELFKELEFEQKLEEALEKTKQLAEDQKELKEKTEEKNESKEALTEAQKDLEKDLDELKKELDKLEELNNELEEKNNLPDQSDQKQKATESMQKASEELDKKNNKKASESQEDAQDALEEMQQQLESFQEQQAQEQASENLEDMRQILENLIDLSHHQERIMQDLKTTKARDPKFVDLAKEQKDIIDDTKVVEDSILALSKRMPELSSKLNKEISSVKNNMDIALDNMTNQRPNQEKKHLETTLVKQQLSMTSLNNLAILFDSMIQQAQQQANSKMKGNGKCDKPGSGKGGKPSAKSMKQAQEQLNKQLEKMRKAMEKGENPKGQKPGQKPGSGGSGGMSKELARMAAQQAAIRQELRKLSQSLNEEGRKPGSALKELEKLMEQTEEDILYQNITQETMRRQQKIMTKLLESEKADRKREMEEKRESKSNNLRYEIPDSIWEEYIKAKEKEIELYKTLPPNLKPYYQNRVNHYFNQFGQE